MVLFSHYSFVFLGVEKCNHNQEVKEQFDVILTLEEQKNNFEIKN